MSSTAKATRCNQIAPPADLDSKAGIAVTLFCALGIAAIMGRVPTLMGRAAAQWPVT